ncbi:TcpE family conjugal transfer membrane protein [Paenibacillus enshidis]|uniref:TcpE family conjugal transfer membrane protein n=1 Tax=Paenibacillus enshidis TaxID=1458439 RepID=A0ABV5AYE0_9BACL
MKERPTVTVSNYTKIWNLDFVMYAFEGKKLPIPANLRVVLTFFACAFIFHFIGKILVFIPLGYKYAFLPGLLTWFIVKQKLDGKAPHNWLLGMIYYFLRPKKLSRYKPIKIKRRYSYDTSVVYRKHQERS